MGFFFQQNSKNTLMLFKLYKCSNDASKVFAIVEIGFVIFMRKTFHSIQCYECSREKENLKIKNNVKIDSLYDFCCCEI